MKEPRREPKKLLLRLSEETWNDVQQLAAADLRSVNAEIEYLLKLAIKKRKKRE